MLALSFWSKARAHDVLGDYAWFWGDFFFLVDTQLVFDGVFKLFPHPMYTVGYAAYYGVALLTRSYTVLLVSMIAHTFQLLFLMLVEEPHMHKVYGKRKKVDDVWDVCEEEREKEEELSQRALFVSAMPQRGVVAVLFVAVGTLSVLCGGGAGDVWPIVVVLVCWRAVHWGACACFLRAEGKDGGNKWMRLCEQRLSRMQAYACWQHVYLVSYIMNHALFLVLALRIRGCVCTSLVKYCTHVLGGGLLVTLASSALISMWRELGAFGFYYGDFFVTPNKADIAEDGVFIYVSHPEVRLGYLAYYGIAIMKQSWGLGSLALFCQVVHEMFLYFIETPNVEIKYHPQILHTPLESAVKSLPGVGILMKVLSRFASNSGNELRRVHELYFAKFSGDFVIRKEKLQADVIKRMADLWRTQIVSRAMDIKRGAETRVGVLDCERMVSLLENRGVRMRQVS